MATDEAFPTEGASNTGAQPDTQDTVPEGMVLKRANYYEDLLVRLGNRIAKDDPNIDLRKGAAVATLKINQSVFTRVALLIEEARANIINALEQREAQGAEEGEEAGGEQKLVFTGEDGLSIEENMAEQERHRKPADSRGPEDSTKGEQTGETDVTPELVAEQEEPADATGDGPYGEEPITATDNATTPDSANAAASSSSPTNAEAVPQTGATEGPAADSASPDDLGAQTQASTTAQDASASPAANKPQQQASSTVNLATKTTPDDQSDHLPETSMQPAEDPSNSASDVAPQEPLSDAELLDSLEADLFEGESPSDNRAPETSLPEDQLLAAVASSSDAVDSRNIAPAIMTTTNYPRDSAPKTADASS